MKKIKTKNWKKQFKETLPSDLGKIIYQEKVSPRELMKSQTLLTIWYFFLAAFFAFLVGGVWFFLIKNYFLFNKVDYTALAVGIFFLPVLITIFDAFKFATRVNIYVVCDNGFAIFTFNRKNELKKEKFFYFQPHYSLEFETKRHFRIHGPTRYNYSDIYYFKDKNRVVERFEYTYQDDDDLQESREKKFFDVVIRTFEFWKRRKEIRKDEKTV